MTRALFALLLIVGQLPVAAAARRRAVRHPEPPTARAAIVTAARQVAEGAMSAGVPAVQIAVSERGQIIYSEAFGVTDKQSATAATPRSVLQIGSITKQFTAAGILRLAERGALSLDDRIEQHVPEFNPRGATITLRQLLSHTSGVRREWFPPGPPWVNLAAPVTRQQTLQGLNSGTLLDSTPGTKWSYSNAGFMLLGLAIENITSQSYADFIRTEFALPLGLLDTGVCGTSNLPVPQGYGQPNGTWVPLTPFHPTVILFSGSLCSTASDLARWAHLLATGHVMLPDSYAAMITPTRLANNAIVPYGLGLDVKNVLGHPAAAHGGSVYGFESFLLYFPDQDIAVAVITNAFPGPAAVRPHLLATAVAQAALDSL
jgi:D-alanyl-D-alanine carboxypeptidase